MEKSMLQKVLSSRTTWTLVAMFVVNGFQAISPSLPSGIVDFVNLALSLLVGYFHINPSQTYVLPTDGSAEIVPMGSRVPRK